VGRLIRFWADIDAPIDRATYLRHGVGLAVLKYLGGAALIWLAAGDYPTPMAYWRSTWTSLHSRSGVPLPEPWLLPALGLWTLPFVWLGVTLTLRRARDAGRSCWWSFLFFVPYVNYALMAALAVAPGVETSSGSASEEPGLPRDASATGVAVMSASAGLLLGVVAVVSVPLHGQYGASLFFGVPFAMGGLAAFLFNRMYAASPEETLGVVAVMFVAAAGVIFLFAAEGILCILMALPLAVVTGLAGATLGRAIARMGEREMPGAFLALLILPLTAAMEPGAGLVLHEVRTSVEIDAPPERVWPHVVAFRPMPEPRDILFRSGIAYPRYARIEGTGVGATRYCVFSTGAFVEPITVWEPGRRLSFDVSASPPPLRELTLFEGVAPPHLDGYLRSRRGEFRLLSLPGGRTQLEGSTWYELNMAPEAYWQLFSDYLIHRIHQRVLDHIKGEVES